MTYFRRGQQVGVDSSSFLRHTCERYDSLSACKGLIYDIRCIFFATFRFFELNFFRQATDEGQTGDIVVRSQTRRERLSKTGSKYTKSHLISLRVKYPRVLEFVSAQREQAG